MNNVKVSICIPAFNQTRYLKKSLNSILIQDYQDYEIIITDDTPSDVVEKLSNNYAFKGRLKYFKNKKTKGSPENWNEAIKHAKGEYIKILHHDDWFTKKDSLSKFVKMLDNNPKANFAFSATLIREILNKSLRSHKVNSKQLELISEIPDSLYFGNLIGSPSATIYRNKLKEKYDKNLKWIVDVDFYIRILRKNNKLVYCPEELICTPNGLSSQVTESCLNNIFICSRKYINHQKYVK